MMLLGRLSDGRGRMPCLIGIDRHRIVVIAQDDLTRFSWPVAAAALVDGGRALTLSDQHGTETHRFTPDLPDRFCWVMTPALGEAQDRPYRWWRRQRRPQLAGLAAKLTEESAAA